MTSRLKQSHLSSLSPLQKKGQQKSLEEQVYEMEIQNIQAQRLRKTFIRMCGGQNLQEKDNFRNQKEDQTHKKITKDKFGREEIIRILNELNFSYTKHEVDQWIWQVDEDLDGAVNDYEFTLMYKRCIFDKTGLEPRNLFNLVQFLMYDLACRNKITVQDTLELIYVRHPDQLEEHIFSIFGQKQKTEDGQEREIYFKEYLQQMRKKDLQRRKQLQEDRKTVSKVMKKDE